MTCKHWVPVSLPNCLVQRIPWHLQSSVVTEVLCVEVIMIGERRRVENRKQILVPPSHALEELKFPHSFPFFINGWIQVTTGPRDCQRPHHQRQLLFVYPDFENRHLSWELTWTGACGHSHLDFLVLFVWVPTQWVHSTLSLTHTGKYVYIYHLSPLNVRTRTC